MSTPPQPRETNASDEPRLSVQWSTLGLLVVGVAVTAAAVLFWPQAERSYPDQLDNASNERLQSELGTIRIFDYSEGAADIKALVFEEDPGDFTLVFYRRVGDRFRRHGAEHNPTGFRAPQLVGEPPRLQMKLSATGEDFRFSISDSGVDFDSVQRPGWSDVPNSNR